MPVMARHDAAVCSVWHRAVLGVQKNLPRKITTKKLTKTPGGTGW